LRPRHEPDGEVGVAVKGDEQTVSFPGPVVAHEETEQRLPVGGAVLHPPSVDRARRAPARRLVHDPLLPPPHERRRRDGRGGDGERESDEGGKHEMAVRSAERGVWRGPSTLHTPHYLIPMRLPIDTYRLPNGLRVTL